MPITQERINVDAVYAQPHAARLMGVPANYLAGLIRAGVVLFVAEDRPCR